MRPNAFLFFLLIAFSVFNPSLAQEKEKPKLVFGMGPAFDQQLSLWGVSFVNEVDFSLNQRISFTPSLTFYHSLGSFNSDNSMSGLNQDFSSGIFINPKLKLDLIQRDESFTLAIAAGPSLQFGSQSFVADLSQLTQGETGWQAFPSKLNRLGALLELEGEWKTKNPKINQAISVSASVFDGEFPWYLMATYKIKLKSWGK